ncbi:hypothetical protein CBS101457_002712 [Exobasidium rhododendri]|nr:hypothetical protein CBS101457_002712 [Exobasidium rhododendri]
MDRDQPSSSKGEVEIRPIEVSIILGEAYVWSAVSIALLRRKYGIIGLLTGSLPLIPQQNAFLGVPLQLFEEEVVYLLRRKAIILVDDIKAHNVEGLSREELDLWQEQRLTYILDKRRLAAEEARELKEKNKKQFAMSEAAKQKKKRRDEKKKIDAEALKNDEGEGEEIFSRPVANPLPSEQLEDDLDNVSHLITIPSSSSGLEWYQIEAGVNAFDSLSSAAAAGLWQYPRTADQRARCAAFEALKAKNYYLGKGLRFGGDFVVYPGDPLRYHSHFTATVQTTPQSLISAQELIAAGRLGTAVKKAHLLCSVRSASTVADGNDHNVEGAALQRKLEGLEDNLEQSWGEVDFVSLTWAGFGV